MRQIAGFRHVAAPLRVYGGVGCLDQLVQELARLNAKRALILTGGTLNRLGHAGRIAEKLGRRCAGVHVGVEAHSPLPAVLDTVAALRKSHADAIVVLGGGSAVITGRAASILLGEGLTLDDLMTRRRADGSYHSPRVSQPKLPQLVIPTTPNSAYVKAGAGVFDPQADERKALFDPATRAQAVFLDRDLLATAPIALVLGATLDNLVLAVEGLMSLDGDALSHAALIHAVHLMWGRLSDLASGDDGDKLRLDLAQAGILAGTGTNNTPAGVCTALGHAIGANFDCDNALAKAVLLPQVITFNGPAAKPGLARVASAMSLTSADQVAPALKRLMRRLTLPESLDAFGITEANLPSIAERAMKDWFVQGNCRPINNVADLLGLLRNVMQR